MTTFKTDKKYLGTNGSVSFRFEVEILKRTAKTITFKTEEFGIKTRRIQNKYHNCEYFYPFNNYSLAPVCRADKEI